MSGSTMRAAAALATSGAGPVVAQDAGKPAEMGGGRAFGPARTSSVVAEPHVDGKVLRVVVGAAEKPWHAGVNTFVNGKVVTGDAAGRRHRAPAVPV